MDDQQKITIQSYTDTVEAFSERTDKDYAKKEAEYFLSLLSPHPRILDLGCGPGRDAREFVERGCDVVGIDPSVGMIEKAKKRAPQAMFHVMTAQELDFEDNSFDGVWASMSLLHIPKDNIFSVLKRVYKLLKVGGILYIAVKMGEGELFEPDMRDGEKMKFWSFFQEDELKDLLEQQKFTILKHRLRRLSPSSNADFAINIFCKK